MVKKGDVFGSAKVSHKRVFVLLPPEKPQLYYPPEKPQLKMAKMLPKKQCLRARAASCQPISVNIPFV